MERKKILVVDDTEFNRDLVIQLLEDDYDTGAWGLAPEREEESAVGSD